MNSVDMKSEITSPSILILFRESKRNVGLQVDNAADTKSCHTVILKEYALFNSLFILENIRAEAHASYKAALEMMDHGKSNKVSVYGWSCDYATYSNNYFLFVG